MIAESRGESDGYKRETARGSSRGCESRASSEDLNAGQSYDDVRVVNPFETEPAA